MLPYPTTTQPHSRVPYPTGQNGHAFPRNPARQTLATWAYVAATMLCCSTFHARDVEPAARRDGCSRGRLLHSWGAFFGLVQRKRPRPRKEIRFATVSHDHAATQPGTVSHRAERISNCGSIARLRRPCQKQAPNLQEAQPA